MAFNPDPPLLTQERLALVAKASFVRDITLPGVTLKLQTLPPDLLKTVIQNEILQLQASIKGTRHREEAGFEPYPATWWDHLKETIRPKLPFRLRQYVKIRYKRVPVIVHYHEYFCPHLKEAKDQDHLLFLRGRNH